MPRRTVQPYPRSAALSDRPGTERFLDPAQPGLLDRLCARLCRRAGPGRTAGGGAVQAREPRSLRAASGPGRRGLRGGPSLFSASDCRRPGPHHRRGRLERVPACQPDAGSPAVRPDRHSGKLDPRGRPRPACGPEPYRAAPGPAGPDHTGPLHNAGSRGRADRHRPGLGRSACRCGLRRAAGAAGVQPPRCHLWRFGQCLTGGHPGAKGGESGGQDGGRPGPFRASAGGRRCLARAGRSGGGGGRIQSFHRF